jgi:NCAIR mutase (PurE)-related protein
MTERMQDFQIDWRRAARTGIPEAVFCAGKTPAQIAAILEHAGERPLLLTRLDADTRAALPRELDYDPLSGTAFHGTVPPATRAGIGIVAAGTSDMPVAMEAARALAFAGFAAPVIADVGVAGLWRLLEKLPDLSTYRVIIAVAGMEGALFSVLAGLVPAPVIAVPRAVGYGVAAGGTAALHAALASCAPGVVTVNIDNGYGAAMAAIKMLRPPPIA